MTGWQRAVTLGLGSLLLCASPPAAQPVLTSEPPHEVAAPGDKDAYDNYSWAIFVALNWPAVRSGAPQGEKKIGDEPQTPRVWETFQDPIEVFQKGDPAREYPEVLRRPAGRKVIYLSAAKKTLLMERDVQGLNLQAGSSWPLIDQLGNYAIYEIRLNPRMVSYINDNKLTTPEGLENHGDLDFPDGSIVVKAAWRIFPRSWITENRKVLDRYYWTTADIDVSASQDPGKKGFVIEQAPIGLVGLHIIQKTAGQPQWIWSTFEQVDNYEMVEGNPASTPTYNNGKATVDDAVNNRQPLLSSGAPPPPDPSDNKVHYLWNRPANLTTAEYTPLAPYTRPQIQRASNEIPLPAAVNQTWQAKLPAPWNHYRLMVTQWTEGGKPGGRAMPRNRDDVSVPRNTALESFLLGDQTLASQVPATRVRDPGDPTRPPQSSLDDMIQATIKATKYPPADETGPLTWSSCLLCHEVAQYDVKDKDCAIKKVVMTDMSMLFRSYLPGCTKE
ncbi:MAG TPA: hypothetical protein VEW48_17380 [Thermoanaerobaculia bacterium]|nr:hypothetical protein [Thermoanaerobaculia bacterium]